MLGSSYIHGLQMRLLFCVLLQVINYAACLLSCAFYLDFIVFPRLTHAVFACSFFLASSPGSKVR